MLCVVVLSVGEGFKREQYCLFGSQPVFSHFLGYPQVNWPFWCWVPGGWVCVHARTLGVSPVNSPVRLGVSPTATIPTGFYTQRLWGFISPRWNPGLHGLSRSPVVPPSLSTCKRGTAQSSSPCLTHPGPPPCLESSLPQLPVSAPPTGLDECFFFNSLVIGHLYSSIFWQFWLFFVFKFVVVLLLVVEEALCIFLYLHLSQKSLMNLFTYIFVFYNWVFYIYTFIVLFSLNILLHGFILFFKT